MTMNTMIKNNAVLEIRHMFQVVNNQLVETNLVVEACTETLDLQKKINTTKDLELLADYVEMLETTA